MLHFLRQARQWAVSARTPANRQRPLIVTSPRRICRARQCAGLAQTHRVVKVSIGGKAHRKAVAWLGAVMLIFGLALRQDTTPPPPSPPRITVSAQAAQVPSHQRRLATHDQCSGHGEVSSVRFVGCSSARLYRITRHRRVRLPRDPISGGEF
jgi:hypothetical protein